MQFRPPQVIESESEEVLGSCIVTVFVTGPQKSTEVIKSKSEDVQNVFLHHINQLSCIQIMLAIFPWKKILDLKTKNCKQR